MEAFTGTGGLQFVTYLQLFVWIEEYDFTTWLLSENNVYYETKISQIFVKDLVDEKGFQFLEKAEKVIECYKFWVPDHNNQILIRDFENHIYFNYHMLCVDFFQWKVVTWKLTKMENPDPGISLYF